jgi:hypothetical protein
MLIPLPQNRKSGFAPRNLKRDSAISETGVFFMPAFYGGLCEALVRVAGFLEAGSANLVQSATIFCFAPDGGGLQILKEYRYDI